MTDSATKSGFQSFGLTTLFVFGLGVVTFLAGNLTLAVVFWILMVLPVTLSIVARDLGGDERSARFTDTRYDESKRNSPESVSPESESSVTGSPESSFPKSSRPTHATDEALAHLRRQYADGAVSEAQFERGIERLLTTETEDEAVVALRNRYARGELTDEQFDRKYDRLRATSTVENAEESIERGAFSGDEYETES
ncbi:SHOCT domain-containing protein [Haladaptatus sp. AB618]|uniref:SHOCT domain-containing protein n=1 Tax=Haladaptatus sp. AB618 TaxID=2934173 RepID=UPI00209BED4B|nr:SHOCT domain-containing protein [Haladaptatus sp. AB618]MCO8254352.1 SHOCT domain-containing protein [Haladaptatus sp. AB618]